MDITRTTDPADPLTAAELRTQCRVYGEAEDDYLLDLARDAVAKIEQDSKGYVYGSGATYQATERAERVGELTLPRFPFDPAGTATASVDGEAVEFSIDWGDTSLPLVTFLGSDGEPTTVSGLVDVDFPAGGTSRIARRACLLLVGHWYEHREAAAPIDVRTVPLAYQSLVDNLKPGGAL